MLGWFGKKKDKEEEQKEEKTVQEAEVEEVPEASDDEDDDSDIEEPVEDDFGNDFADAGAADVGGVTAGALNFAGDADVHRLDVAEGGQFRIFTTGDVQTLRRLFDENGNLVATAGGELDAVAAGGRAVSPRRAACA